LTTRAAAHDRGVEGPTRKRGFRFTDHWFGAALALPAIISVFLVIIYPLLNTVIVSFQKVDIFKHTTTFVGLANYVKLYNDPLFANALKVNLEYGVIVLVLATVLGLLFGLLLNESFPGRGFFRAILILPWALPWVIIGLLWGWIVDAQFGSLNGLLYQLGIIHKYVAFLAMDNWALFFTTLATVWRQASFSGILFLAALQAIPVDQYDAAQVDGAGLLGRFRYITFPWLQPTVLIAVLINTLFGIMQFDVVFMMTEGGPGNATTLLSILLYRKAFLFSDFGGSAAVSMLLAVLCLGVGLIFVRMLYRPKAEISA
jgi:multiple sugar transport system permease protein